MKTILKFTTVTLIVFTFIMCNNKQNESKEAITQKAKNFDWLLGKTNRTDFFADFLYAATKNK